MAGSTFNLKPFVGFVCLSFGFIAEASEKNRGLELFESKIRPLLVNRCYDCHSKESESLKAKLFLDRRETIVAGGESGPAIVPGDAASSLLIQRIRGVGERMPPEGRGRLSAAEIEAMVEWVSLGAPWPNPTSADHQEGYRWDRLRDHWAWRPLSVTPPPVVEGDYRMSNPIDRFVVARLAREGLSQAEAARPAILVRRLYLDLLGLPPRPSELQDWVEALEREENSARPQTTWVRLVDELLSRPEYGERWGRHWLDVARYSDAGGWTQDNRKLPNAWRYRDWVVGAFNGDLAYDDFVRHQIAGDQDGPVEAIGTGFLALGPRYSSDGGDPESIAQAKGETLDDRVDTFSRAFLGLTVSCARCHDHKFDPIPTEDYYSIAGVFNNSREGETPLVAPPVVKAYHDHQKAIRSVEDRMRKARQVAEGEKRELTGEEKRQLEVWKGELEALKKRAPSKYAYAHTLHDHGSEDMAVALRGNLLKKGPMAPRRFLRILAGEGRDSFREGSGRRQLAEAVVSKRNPLAARVMVNRVWMNHFGQGLVRTPSNFGQLGESPTHPELLDWLADRLVRSDWSLKALHRLILGSATYRSGSVFNRDAFDLDGDNRMLWRMNPRRMDVETWRDSLLAVTGELEQMLGGPPVENIVGSSRRTLYAKVSRNDPSNSDRFLRLFDFPIPRASSAQRTANVMPQQFLFMMNSPFMLARANAFADRLTRENETDAERIDAAYLVLYGRKPTEEERREGLDYLRRGSSPEVGLTRWKQYCQVLLGSNEFMYVR